MKRFFSILCATLAFVLSLYATLVSAQENPELSQIQILAKHLWMYVLAIVFVLLHLVIERSDDQ